MTLGFAGQTPWSQLDQTATFLCPVPGYDRHFALTEGFGIKMIPIPMTNAGPDMDLVEQHVNNDASVKGMWCVPKYSNPTGATYSADTVARMAALKPAAADFRIFWDNAYAAHDLSTDADTLASIKDACAAAGSDDLWIMFASTSKITLAGAGIAALAASPGNLAEIKARLNLQTIGPDKINQLRHVRFLEQCGGVRPLMQQHAAILAPKFETVLRGLDAGLAGTDIGNWTRPNGGYFISFDGLPNTAKRTIALAKEAGMMLTEAGATYPYGKDPADSNIRIAPSYPSVAELEEATQLLVICVKIASLETLLG
jgi:DNA-binding transcriptional MocR family regulator